MMKWNQHVEVEKHMTTTPENTSSYTTTPSPKGFGKRKTIVSLILIVLLGTAGYAVYRNFVGAKDANYLTSAARVGSITDAVQATGTIEPVQRAELRFKNSADVFAITLQPGDSVTQGQVLAQQDASALTAQVRQSESDVRQQQAQLQTLEKAKRNAAKNLDQQQQLFDGGFLSQSDLDSARDAYEKSESDLISGQAKLENTMAKLDMDKTDLDSAKLTAPFSGIVSAVDSQAGLSGGSSSSSSSALITLISEELQLKALVNEVDVGRVQAGQVVEFTASAYANETFSGTVVKISPESTTVSNVQFYPVLITCDNPKKLLRAGMSVNAKVIVSRQQNVLTIPMMAVNYAQSYLKSHPSNSTTPSDSNEAQSQSQKAKGSQVGAGNTVRSANNRTILILENGQPVAKQVTVGLNDTQNIEIVEGLKEGDMVVIGSGLAGSSSGSDTSTTRNSNQNNNRPQGGAGMMFTR